MQLEVLLGEEWKESLIKSAKYVSNNLEQDQDLTQIQLERAEILQRVSNNYSKLAIEVFFHDLILRYAFINASPILMAQNYNPKGMEAAHPDYEGLQDRYRNEILGLIEYALLIDAHRGPRIGVEALR